MTDQKRKARDRKPAETATKLRNCTMRFPQHAETDAIPRRLWPG